MNKYMMWLIGLVGVGAIAAYAMGGEDVIAEGQSRDPETNEYASWKVVARGDEFEGYYQLPGQGWVSAGRYSQQGMAMTAAGNIIYQQGFTEPVTQASTAPGRASKGDLSV